MPGRGGGCSFVVEDPAVRLPVAVPRFLLLAPLGGDSPPAGGLKCVDGADDDGDNQQDAEAADDHRNHGDHLPMRCGRLCVVRDNIIEFLPREWTPATVVAVAQGPDRAQFGRGWRVVVDRDITASSRNDRPGVVTSTTVGAVLRLPDASASCNCKRRTA